MSEERGFLIKKPVVKLPEKFAKWEAIAKKLVPLLKENKYRQTIDNELEVIGKSWLFVGPYLGSPRKNPHPQKTESSGLI